MAAGDPLDKLARVAQDHSDATQNITESFTKELIAAPVPPLIYHYTNDSGLRGILESGQLWLTNIFNLNDPSELNHGIGLAIDILKRQASDGPREAKVFSELCDQALTGMVDTSAHYFVCCFSKTDHDLGQWRAYADDGRGYAIGFDAKLLEQPFSKALPEGASLQAAFPVTYDDTQLCKIHEQLVTETLPVISAPRGMGLNKAVISKFLQQLSVNLVSSCLFISLFFKHEAYTNEEEYRFLQMYPAESAVPGLKIRSRPYSLVKYREFDWKSVAAESVIEVIAGPADDQKVAFNFANDCLREYPPALGIPPVKRSEIPYRSVRQ